jgi:hypothetical protein
MDETQDILRGTVVGMNLVRSGQQIASTGVVVRLDDGREVGAVIELQGLAEFGKRSVRIGDLVEVDLGTVLEPIRIVGILGRK